MMAVILSGGKGTRLKPFTMTIPKPLLPLGDVPILEVVIRQLAEAGFKRVVIALGHMAPFFTTMLGEGQKWGIEIEYCIEDEPLGTAGALRLAKDLEETFLVMNGDLLTTIDYRSMWEEHLAKDAWATVGVSKRHVDIDYGVVESTPEGELSGYNEKPTIYYEVSMGINVLSRRALEYLPSRGKFDMPDLMLALKRANRRVFCYKTSCYWQDIGRFEDYQQASADFVADSARFFRPAGRSE